MATFTLTGHTNIDALTGKTGGDTYNTAGFTLTIDQDSRTGLNQTTSSSLGSMTITAATGGQINIDGTQIWMIPFTEGSGNVPAWNTIISNGTGSGKLIGVHSSLTTASVATGAAMPTSGFIRVKQKSGTYQAGALSGLTASASDEGRVGWIEIVGDSTTAPQSINANRLGSVNITGEWYEIGITNGSSNQTMQIPNNGLLRFVAGVFIEKTAGQGDYEFYPNAGTATTIGTEESRGKVVWIDNTGLVRIGNSGSATNGYTPISGLKVVIGNVFLENTDSSTRTTNSIPTPTLGSRYDFTTTGGGVISINKCNMAWYLSCSQAYSVTASNTGFVDAISLSEIATASIFTNCGIGCKPTVALVGTALTISFCYAGGIFTNCVWSRASLPSTGQYTVVINDSSGFIFDKNTIRSNTNQGHATVYSIYATRVKNCTWISPTIIVAAINLITCDTINITNTIYINNVSGTTPTTYVTYVWNLSTTTNSFISGLTFPVTNCHPYTALLLAASGCSNIKLRNIGTRVTPLTFGSANACGLIYSMNNNCSNFKFQRIYVSNTRTGLMTGDNSCVNIREENVFGDYADSADVMAILNQTRKGMGGTGALTAQTSVYGSHWSDCFTSTTAGRINILMNEANALTIAQVTTANGAAFTSAGGLYMPAIGQTTTFTMPEYIKGHTGFTNTALVMAGGTVGNYRFDYSIDLNNGNGFSAMTTASYTAAQLGTALNQISSINAEVGFKLKLQITTTTTNSTAITSVYITTTSTTTAQDYQYPLDTITLTLTGLTNGSDIVILQAGTTTVITNVDQNNGTTWDYVYETLQNIDIGVYKSGKVPYFIRNYALSANNASLPIAQVTDRNYL